MILQSKGETPEAGSQTIFPFVSCSFLIKKIRYFLTMSVPHAVSKMKYIASRYLTFHFGFNSVLLVPPSNLNEFLVVNELLNGVNHNFYLRISVRRTDCLPAVDE